MSSSPPAPRISALFARDAKFAVLLRRGPTKWTHLIAWDTAHDAFQEGAWFRGSLYPERSALSPDGRLLVYFAFKGNVGTDGVGSAWTAVSKVPWFTALCMWPQDTTYYGGGAFSTDTDLLVSAECIEGRHRVPSSGPLNIRYSNAETVSRHRFNPSRLDVHAPPDADWFGFDHGGNLVYTRAGVLFRFCGNKHRPLRDFNGTHPDPTPPPRHATHW